MEYLANHAAVSAENFLRDLIFQAQAETAKFLEANDIPGLLWHFKRFREAFYRIEEQFEALQAEVDWVSQRDIPTLFGNSHVKTMKIEGLGRVTVNVRWFGSMRKGKKPLCLDWLNANEAEGLIIETVPAPTLGVFAKTRALEGKPLPDDLFDVSTKSNTSITKD